MFRCNRLADDGQSRPIQPTSRRRLPMLKLGGRGMRGDKTPVRLMVIGLSHENLRRLREKKPITFKGEEVDIPNVEVIIFSGETEQSMTRDLQKLITPETITNFSPRVTDA